MMELERVRRTDVQQLIDRVAAKGKSRHTLDNLHNLLRSIFREAIRDEYLDSNPAVLINMPPPEPRKPKEIPAPDKIQAVLDALEEPYATLACTENDLVFQYPEGSGQVMTEQHALRQGLQKAAKQVGISLTYHQLRHWSGTMLHRAGVDVKAIQSRLGHSRWQTTADWYIENDNAADRKAAELASHFVAKSGSNCYHNCYQKGDSKSPSSVSH
jgi:site-specific recombinase XerD